ncbi:hypothetical protein [Gilliamella apicola]|uniref:Uncharacterized protein n=1 Tax=Gilliamella apicola TaxID=1196095 RepID=A0A242NG62_9GAMM|nr:hypothetical protein [Gilliamella apicola]OTP82630.1 hypothetical protein B5S40_06335 [Gilliamella apicola]OTP85001.1 hypothetical protein B5S44_07560 [Gilliamella apicola]OTP98866.1 hypothetical protein B6D08_09525 [Gilliamella apicola]OTQ10559.1 hypothetical protein B6C91_05245 [Gilliamella apicola]OTQ16925.1 hypothetical protein B6D11_02975 [Gilliamella apicola]
MDKFPRDKQNQLLTMLYDKFPDVLSSEEYNTLVKLFGTERNLYSNLWYLYQHGLIEDFQIASIPMNCDITDLILIEKIKITTKGIDFIRDDGGLSAIINVTTIKVHNETLDKLEDIINKSSLTPAEKATYLGKLKELPVDATKHLVLKLLDLGLSRTPDVIQLISSYCQS